MSILLHLRARWALKAQLIPLLLNLSLSVLSSHSRGLFISVFLSLFFHFLLLLSLSDSSRCFLFFSYYLQMFDKGLLPPSSPLSVLLFLCQPHCVSWTKPTNSEHIYKRKAATLMFSGHSWEALLTNRKTAIFPFIITFIVGKTIHWIVVALDSK